MKNIINPQRLTNLLLAAVCAASMPLAAIVEVGTGYGYMSYDLVDRGQSKYILNDNTYSGGFARVFAHVHFPLKGLKAAAGAMAAFPNFSNDIMTSADGVSISFPWSRFGLDGKVSVDWQPRITPYFRMALGYESWQVKGNYAGTNFEYGQFSGSYGEGGAGVDIQVIEKLRLFAEVGVAVGYQTGRFMDPEASMAAKSLVYYDTSTRTRGIYAAIGLSLNF